MAMFVARSVYAVHCANEQRNQYVKHLDKCTQNTHYFVSTYVSTSVLFNDIFLQSHGLPKLIFMRKSNAIFFFSVLIIWQNVKCLWCMRETTYSDKKKIVNSNPLWAPHRIPDVVCRRQFRRLWQMFCGEPHMTCTLHTLHVWLTASPGPHTHTHVSFVLVNEQFKKKNNPQSIHRFWVCACDIVCGLCGTMLRADAEKDLPLLSLTLFFVDFSLSRGSRAAVEANRKLNGKKIQILFNIDENAILCIHRSNMSRTALCSPPHEWTHHE